MKKFFFILSVVLILSSPLKAECLIINDSDPNTEIIAVNITDNVDNYNKCANSCETYFEMAEWCVFRYKLTQDRMYLYWGLKFLSYYGECVEGCYDTYTERKRND